MSAFLGPVHEKMYGKILAQDEITEALLQLAEGNGWAPGLRQQVDAQSPAAQKAPLADIIDTGNIHGWLSATVLGSESRFAAVTCGMLDGHPQRLAAMQEVMKARGQSAGLPADVDAEGAFQAIHDILLDGMPCDFPFQVIDSRPDAVEWTVTSCPHAAHWQSRGCEAETFYKLRDAWIEGALAGTGITHSRDQAGNAHLKKGRLG